MDGTAFLCLDKNVALFLVSSRLVCDFSFARSSNAVCNQGLFSPLNSRQWLPRLLLPLELHLVIFLCFSLLHPGNTIVSRFCVSFSIACYGCE